MRISDWSSDVCSSDLIGIEVHSGRPRISAELPETGERFEGILPPVVAAPAFAIRKPAVAVFTLDDYSGNGIMSRLQAAVLRKAVADRANILIAGDRKSVVSGKSVSVRVDLGGRRIIKKKTNKKYSRVGTESVKI